MDWEWVVIDLQVVYIHLALVTSGVDLKHCKKDDCILLTIEKGREDGLCQFRLG